MMSCKSARAQDSQDPCDYCPDDECSAPQDDRWVCCNDGNYQACFGGTIGVVRPKFSGQGCIAGPFLCDDPVESPCVGSFVFSPFSQGGSGQDFNSTCASA